MDDRVKSCGGRSFRPRLRCLSAFHVLENRCPFSPPGAPGGSYYFTLPQPSGVFRAANHVMSNCGDLGLSTCMSGNRFWWITLTSLVVE